MMSETAVGATSFRGFWRSFRRSRMGLVGLFMLLVVVLMAVFAPVIAPYDPKEVVRVTIDDIYAAPSATHWLGTDDTGRDAAFSLNIAKVSPFSNLRFMFCTISDRAFLSLAFEILSAQLPVMSSAR